MVSTATPAWTRLYISQIHHRMLSERESTAALAGISSGTTQTHYRILSKRESIVASSRDKFMQGKRMCQMLGISDLVLGSTPPSGNTSE